MSQDIHNLLEIPNSTIISEKLNEITAHARWLYIVILSKFSRTKDDLREWYEFRYIELTQIVGYDERTICSCIRQLEKAGFVEVLHGGKNKPSKYRPTLKWLNSDPNMQYPVGKIIKGKMLYKNSHWRNIRNKRLKYDSYKCVECGNIKDLHVHHLTYKRRGNELLEDLQTLCSQCHSRCRT